MSEESGESFSCPTGTEAHTCGHDFHAAMLLTAAKMLKEKEAMLSGKVRFMFQPAEETFEGAKDMLGEVTINCTDFLRSYKIKSTKKGVSRMTETKQKRKPRKYTDEFKQ